MDDTLKELGVQMLIVDEIHNIPCGSANKRSLFMNTLKELSNRLHIPIVLVGIQDALRDISTDIQISSRFSPITLSRRKFNRE